MRKPLTKLKRLIKRLFKVREDIDLKVDRKRSRIMIKFLMGIVSIILISLLYPMSNLYGPLDIPVEGNIATENIIADFSFDILKDASQLEEERLLAIRSTPLFIDYNENTATTSREELKHLFISIDSLGKENVMPDSIVYSLAENYPFIPLNWLKETVKIDSLTKHAILIDIILADSIYYYGVINDLKILPPDEYNSIIMNKAGRDLLMTRDQLIDLPKAYKKLLDVLNNYPGLSDQNVELFYQISRHFILPNTIYNAMATQIARDSVAADISSIEQHISNGDLIIRRGTRVDRAKVRLLNAYAVEQEKMASEKGAFYSIMPIIARLVLVAAIVILLYLFFYHFRADVFWSNNKMLAILMIIGLTLFLEYFIGGKMAQSVYLIPIAILSILITVLFDARLGVVVTLLVAILLGVLNRFDFSVTLITAIAGSVACFSAGEIRKRSEFYRIIISLSLFYIVIALVIESLKLSKAGDLLTYFGYGLANGLVSPLLTIGILPFFESLFGFSTNITLLELADLNHPLLKRLAMEAPGTYHHSIIVGNLGEAAAKAINANPLLTRVGAYYHDIGKMEIPEYFIENQLGIKSKHESLNPTMSALVLTSHVKKGRIIGEEAGLPDAVVGFIEEHHGTTKMTYFYNKAKQMDMPIDDSEAEFRYQGPKPQSKETAIIMLADSSEAASRTLDNPTPARIRNLIQKLINDKIATAELTQCELTLRDLDKIREAFVKVLIGVFHQRIEYPDQDDEDAV